MSAATIDCNGDDWPEDHVSQKPATELPDIVSTRPDSPNNRRVRYSNENNKRKHCWSEQGNIYRRRRRYQRTYEEDNSGVQQLQCDDKRKYRTPKRFLARYKKIKTDDSDSMEYDESSSDASGSYDERSQSSMESEEVNNLLEKIDTDLNF